jgi:hypothetical protein
MAVTWAGLGGLAELGFLELLETVHIEVAVGLEPVLVSFDGKGSNAAAGLASVLVMAGFLTGIDDVEHHQPAMTASSLQRFCRTFNTLLPLMVKTRLADCRHTKTTQRPQRAK